MTESCALRLSHYRLMLPLLLLPLVSKTTWLVLMEEVTGKKKDQSGRQNKSSPSQLASPNSLEDLWSFQEFPWVCRTRPLE
jgi:hypothetical protein